MELAWWFNVGVQMFFCISGFLYANKRLESAIDFISKNLRKILIPYFCFLVPIIVIYFFFARDSITVTSVASALLTSGVINGIEHLWFIPYILFFNNESSRTSFKFWCIYSYTILLGKRPRYHTERT